MKSGKRSVCPVACVLDILGDKWTLLLIRDMACGKSLFKEFLASPEKIATNILSDRLLRLVQHGLVEKRALAQHSGRDAYVLSEKGKTLMPLLNVVTEWGLAHLPGTEAKLRPQRKKP